MSPEIESLRAENERTRREIAEVRSRVAALRARRPPTESAAPTPVGAGRYRVIFEHAVEAILVCRIEDGRPGQILCANAAMRASAGYSLEEMQAMKARDLRPPGADPPAYGRQLFAEGWAQGDDVAVRRDGTRAPIEVRVGLTDFAGEPAAMFFMRNVSERRRLETLVRDLVEQAPDGIFITDEAARFTEVNPAACRMLGYPREELIGRTVADLLDPADLPRLAEARERVGRLGTLDLGEWTLRCEDGSLLPVEIRTTVEGGRIRRAFVRDVSARRRLEEEREAAEEALRASEQRYRVLFEEAAEPIVAYRVAPDHLGEIVAANAAAAVITGYTRDELDRMTVQAISIPEERPYLPAWIAQLMSAGKTFAEGHVLARDGSVRTAAFLTTLTELGGEPVALSVGYDLTERTLAQEALRASEERHRMVFENAAEGVFVFRVDGGREGEIVAANPAAAALTGYSVDELCARAMQSIAAEEALRAVPAAMRRLRADGWAEGRTVLIRKDGAPVAAAFRTGLAHLDGERVAIAFAHDASAQQRAEKALREARDLAQSANRAKTTFLADMSHEIRTPMNAILGFVQLLQRDPAVTDEQRRALRIIDRSGDHLLEMINDVLEMSKIEAGHRQLHEAPFDLTSLIDDIARMFELRAEEQQLRFAVRVGSGVPRHVVADEGKLRQVLVNLLSNAVRLTREGGVTLRLGTGPRAGAGVRLTIEVEDTGPGIAAGDLQRIFRPFEQATDGARGGTGLGLPLSRELLRLMGGEITVESRLGAGSVFQISLPVTVRETTVDDDESEGPPSSRRVVGLEGAGAPPSVLVADDSDDGRSWLSSLLRQIGFRVAEARDGAEAVAACDIAHPDVVLMDLRMPVMDGFTAIRAIRSRDGARPAIIALTASAFDDTGDAVRASGADGWIRKPCREGEILQAIADHTGVRYRRAPPRRRQSPIPPSPARDLPAELAGPIRAAARVADHDVLSALIEALPPEHQGAGASLRRLAAEYAYDRIEDLLA